jgi:hypothetical protein
MEVSCQLYDPTALPPGKKNRYLLDRKLGGPQSRSGRGGEEKKKTFPAPVRNRTPVVHPVADKILD